ncbi:peptidylprolyl isomerase [Pseudactinotalea sp. Z1732]|uniref:peptidylprolyl isomerase n=1 Tax=Micrococcales TaxID=85006 RepID=UPI003C7A2B36
MRSASASTDALQEEPGLSPSKRERERARQLHDKRLGRQQRAKVRRQRTIAIVVVGTLVLSGLVIALLTYGFGGDDSDQAETPTDPGAQTDPIDEADQDAPPADPEPLASIDAPQYDAAPDASLAEDRTWQATIDTSVGTVQLELDGAAAPQAVANFVHLASDGYFDGTACHRLLPESLLQCGDPTATGTGGPGYSFGPIENAPEDDVYPAGTVAMARVGGDGESMGSQFFLVFADVPLPADDAGGYSVFGTVTEGLDLLAEVGAAGLGTEGERPAIDVIIENVEIQ